VGFEYPHISQQAKIELSNKMFEEYLKTHDIEKSVKLLSEKKQYYQKFYLLGSDSYYYLYLTKKLLSTGKLSDTYLHNKFFDPLMLAPVGSWRNIELHPYVGLLTYKIFKFFKPNICLVNAVSITPLLLYAISVIFFLVICFSYLENKFVIFVSCIFFSLSPIFIKRSSIGWYDTDPYIIIFLLITTWIFSKSIASGRKYYWIILLGALNALFYLFWQGASLLSFYIIITFAYLIVRNIISKSAPANVLWKMLIFIISLFIFLCIFITPKGLIAYFNESINIAKNFLSGSINKWPDIFIMVGELKKPSLNKIIQMLGGYIFITISVIGEFCFIINKTYKSRALSIVLTVFFILSLVLAITAERFVLLLMPFASIAFAFGLNRVNIILQSLFSRIPKIKNKMVYAITYTLLSLLIISPFIRGNTAAASQHAIFNPVWEKSLEKIKSQTPENSILYTWWPPGHFIKAFAERGICIDGATFEKPNSYWIARFFLAETEKEALAIINMLNSAGNSACDYLISKGLPLDESITLLNKLFSIDHQSAMIILRNKLCENDIDMLLPLMFSPQNPSYCLLYNEMIEHLVGFYFLKHWDFEKKLKIKEPNILNKKSTKYTDYLWSISKKMPYTSKEIFQTSSQNDTVYFSKNISVNISKLTAKFNRLEGRVSGIPKSIIYNKEGNLKEKKLPNATTELSLMLIQHDNKAYSCIVGYAEILKSILFRLYYLDGAGLSHFKKIIDEDQPLFNTKILVFKID